jgi:hypothetical protein
MMMMAIKNYYIGTPLPRFEYMKMLLSRFPEKIIRKYNLNALAVDGWVYIENRKGVYGLKQVGLLANQLLQTRLAPFTYYTARHTRDYGYIRLRQFLSAKLLPLPQPPVRARTNARTNPSAQRATQLMSVLARMYAVSI